MVSILKTVCLIIIIIMVTTFCLGFGQPQIKGRMVTETYTVQPGDTLWNIAEKYIVKNTYGPRDIREFQEGIVEANNEVFRGRVPKLIIPGDVLIIKYWVREDNQ
jgi:nucleoid-associated protein YgaU